jgi:hypothetical protein
MISNVFRSLITRPLVLAMLALVAAAAGYGSSAEARSGQPAADNRQSSATLTVRSTRYGRILFDGRGRALYAFTRVGAASATALAPKRGRCTLRKDDSLRARA